MRPRPHGRRSTGRDGGCDTQTHRQESAPDAAPFQLRALKSSVVVAVAVVRMMEMVVDEIIRVSVMRHAIVAAVGSMHVGLVVSAAGVTGRARGLVAGARLDRMLIDVVAVQVVQMAVVQVIGVTVVSHRRVAAIGSVCMSMTLVLVATGRHGQSPLSALKG
jgi:hypothetical protein